MVERVLVVGMGVRVFGFKDVRVSLHVRMSGVIFGVVRGCIYIKWG